MESDPELLRGIVELDETYIGGKPRKRNRPMPPAPMPLFDKPEAVKPEPKRKDRKDRKKRGRGGGHTMAITAAQRGGKARMAPLPSHSTEEIAVFIRRWIDSRAVISTG